jgi:hypothetical protein
MVQLELGYLHEIGRLTIGGADIIADLERRVGLRRSDQPLDALVDTAAALTWTRDPSTGSSWRTHSSPVPHSSPRIAASTVTRRSPVGSTVRT